MKIKIWCPDNESEEDADEFEVGDPPSASGTNEQTIWNFSYAVERQVRNFVKQDHPHSDYWSQATFCARVGAELRTYSVSVEMEPVFYIAEVKPKPRAPT